MGPLYHLLEYEDRLAALRESCRILKKGGLLFAAGISRFASCIDGLTFEFCKDPEFQKILHQDLETGHHKNPTNNEFYFTDGYFHRPEELNSEIAAAGFKPTAIHAIEGIAYMIKDFEKNWHDKKYREVILDIIRRIDREASLLGASPHIMCVACKK
jgi:ubiquinone/menaquinone biosynthesis C-methylase UbiE